MKMHDMGMPIGKLEAPTSGKKREKYYPSLYLDQDQMKALGVDGAKVGDELQMVAKVRVRSMSQSISGGGSIDIEIREAAIESPEKDSAAILYGDG